MNVEKNSTICRTLPTTAPFDDIVLPFNAKTEVTCTHSSGSESHSWSNAFYALDLANSYFSEPATVRAAKGGKVFVFGAENGSDCPIPTGTPDNIKPDKCGNGWGNRIKILHQGGYVTFYAHLAKFLVKTGDVVKRGQPIGIEGGTGLAGHRHLHWSVQKIPGDSVQEWENRITWDGESVPFKFKAILNGQIQILDSSLLKCPHANIGQAENQPRLRGINNVL